ncbi:MAG: HIT domain-containing protein [Bacteroidales bacterium]|nr:HIT domain-containing protein [Bacteroidales bacterium]
MQKCPFCHSKIEESVFAETLLFRAIVNIAPILPGHVLIIPKKHIVRLIELTDDELFEMIKFSRQIIRILENIFKTDAFDWTIQEKEEAGQSIPHLHLHIIPRLKGDLPEPGAWFTLLKNNDHEILDSDKRQKLTNEELVRIVNILRKIYKIDLIIEPRKDFDV